MDGFRQLVGVLHQPVHLGAGAGDAHGVGLLEAIGADHESGHLTRQHDDRDAVHQRVSQACHRVGGAGARGHKGHAGLAGGPCVPFGHVDGPLFVTHKDVADIVLLKDRVIDGQHSATRIAKDDLNALILQRLHHHIGTGHLPFGCGQSWAHIGHRLCPLHRQGRHGLAQQKAPEDQSGAHGNLSGSTVTGPYAFFLHVPKYAASAVPLSLGRNLGGCGGRVNRKNASKVSQRV